MKKQLLFSVLIILFSINWVLAQTASVCVTLTDDKTNEPIAFATVQLYDATSKSAPIKEVMTDVDGKFLIDSLNSGTYEIRSSYAGYNKTKVKISLQEGFQVYVTIELKRVKYEYYGCFFGWYPPLFDPWDVTTKTTFTSEEIRRMPIP